MAGWEPNFRMSNVDQGPSVTQILNQGLGGFLNRRVDQLTAEEDKATRAKERQQDVDFRQAQADTAKEQWRKSYDIANAQEGRAVSDDLMKRNTREAYAQADTLLGAPGMTQVQAAKFNPDTNPLLLRAQRENRTLTPQEEGILAGQANRAIQANKSLLGQRQLLMEQAPVKELYTPQADGTVLTRTDIDPTAQINLKEARLGDIDKKLADQARTDQEWKLLGARQAFEKGENDKTRAAAKAKETKEETVSMFKTLPDGQQHMIEVPMSKALAYEGVGFTQGKVSGTRNPIPAAKVGAATNPDKLFEAVAGTSSYLGGADKYDLAAAADKLKMIPEYKKIPRSVIDNAVAADSKSGISDNISLKRIKQKLDEYK